MPFVFEFFRRSRSYASGHCDCERPGVE
jgi:hypothetical protein